MEFEKKNPRIFIIAGKARNGKDTIGNYIEEYYESQKCIRLQYSHYIKEYAMHISNWDGSIYAIYLKYFAKEDIHVYSYFFDVIIITDARLEIEITTIQETFSNVTVIHVERPNLVTELTMSQQQHRTEVGLDHFNNYDYNIVNDSTLDQLKEKVETILEEVE